MQIDLRLYVYFLAHRSRRLIGELMLQRLASSSTISNIFFSETTWPIRASQILRVASMVRGNESLFVTSWSLDQDGRHALIWSKPFKNLLWNQ